MARGSERPFAESGNDLRVLARQREGSPAYERARQLAGQVARLAREILGAEIEVIWYGSWVRGRAHAHSDLDVAIRSASPLPHSGFARLQAAVDELPTLYSIDVVDLRKVGETLRREIEEHGIRL